MCNCLFLILKVALVVGIPFYMFLIYGGAFCRIAAVPDENYHFLVEGKCGLNLDDIPKPNPYYQYGEYEPGLLVCLTLVLGYIQYNLYKSVKKSDWWEQGDNVPVHLPAIFANVALIALSIWIFSQSNDTKIIHSPCLEMDRNTEVHFTWNKYVVLLFMGLVLWNTGLLCCAGKSIWDNRGGSKMASQSAESHAEMASQSAESHIV